MDLVSAENLGKHFASRSQVLQALKGVSVRFEEGAIASIVGPSGCGKTTLLRLAAGLIAADEGSVTVDGKSPRQYRSENGIGFVFQRPLLFPWRNVTRNLLLPSEISRHGSCTESDLAKARELLELVGLSGFGRFYPRQLSGGMLQRAAMARALMTDPRLLFLDEPFSAVDELTRENLWVDFRRIWVERELTVILVTHSIREAVFLSDRVLVMSNRPGTIAYDHAVTLDESRNSNTVFLPIFQELCLKIRQEIAAFPEAENGSCR